MTQRSIKIHGCSEHNLKHISLSIPHNSLTTITGVSGSGKSSLAFDTIYAEGQRRYIDTFSPYARQFLDRMEKPAVDRIDEIPPAVAINQTNPVRTSRSTVGTMTELHDYLTLLFARVASLYCRGCGQEVVRDTPHTIYRDLIRSPRFKTEHGSRFCMITFSVPISGKESADHVKVYYRKKGFTKFYGSHESELEIVQDRIRCTPNKKRRIVDALENALQFGRGHIKVYPLDADRNALDPQRYSSRLQCAACNIEYAALSPGAFSFNSPLGACETCRGFGETMTIDEQLVIPDPSKSLREGAIQPWQSNSYRGCHDELLHFARQRDVNVDTPWNNLSRDKKNWVLYGEGEWHEGVWYGVHRFFDWLASKSYKMHIRMLLAKYRGYVPCTSCNGTRLKPHVLCWKIANASIADVNAMSLAECASFFSTLTLSRDTADAVKELLQGIRSRLTYLIRAGLSYLTLKRKSRTLSGGEVQRINLTTALGTSLVHTLFVLDEPSIGMHPRDIGRLTDILRSLRDEGNTVLVVEHDPDIILASEYLVELGPGPGEHGGEIIAHGSAAQLRHDTHSPTGRYLASLTRCRPIPPVRRPVTEDTSLLTIHKASAHNLKNITVSIPLHRLVCITGVSGSGKSTFLEHVCYKSVARKLHKAVSGVGAHEKITGASSIDDIVLVDQTPLSKTPRSNPVSYLGAFDGIRKVFGTQPLAVQRGYTPSHFSFNSPKGRCPACKGSGYEHIEMQFLSDVYLPCEECDTARYRKEILEVTVACAPHAREKDPSLPGAASIQEVLSMTASSASLFFEDHPAIVRPLKPLIDAGLGYLTLGQPLATLSGGEAQRVKLASYIARSRKKNNEHILYLFDEPTTGLHPEDIETLVQACNTLVEEGHSLVIIEHNLDVIVSADSIIDLGPEGGNKGGEVVATGSPATIARSAQSHTGKALSAHFDICDIRENHRPRGLQQKVTHKEPPGPGIPEHSSVSGICPPDICIRHAREHNLKNVDISIPYDKITVITGVSGSGKSTVAFDILFSEGQRRYLDSLNAYTRQFIRPSVRPDADSVAGIPPSVAISQRTTRSGSKSTVATVTEVYNYLRLLFVKLGIQYCPECNQPVQEESSESIRGMLMSNYRGRRIYIYAPLVIARKGYYTDLAEWARKKGFAFLLVDGKEIPTNNWPRLSRYREHTIELPVTSLVPDTEHEEALTDALDNALQKGNGFVRIYAHDPRHKKDEGDLYSTTRMCPRCHKSFAELDPRLFSFNSRHGWCPACLGTGKKLATDSKHPNGTPDTFVDTEPAVHDETCDVCNGTRLRPLARSVRFHGYTIVDFMAMSIKRITQTLPAIKLDKRERRIAHDILDEIDSRLSFLHEVGLSYLTLGRGADTLSGGEAQRIRLASQLGTNLNGVCYILDEPTIGLHPRDNRRLCDTLRRLTDKGNTTVIVEHDEEMIRNADYIIDMGPGGGNRGGEVMATGTLKEIKEGHNSVTGTMLRSPLPHPLLQLPSRYNNPQSHPHLSIRNARLNNLKNIRVDFPLNTFVCVTGVSGSGKSTLVREIMYTNGRRVLSATNKSSGRRHIFSGCDSIHGLDAVRRIAEVDQAPIGKTPRSCPATYVGIWDRIRRLFAGTTLSQIRGYTAGRYSFNVKGGRCESCAGKGVKKIEMNFLPDAIVTCDVCQGARFNPETLEVTFKHKTIADVLDMSVDEAVEFFKPYRSIHRILQLLQEVGLGYIGLGQQSPTLSGGEAQRIKLAAELSKAHNSDSETATGEDGPAESTHTLYVLDEPTIGLHAADIEKLLHVLHRLVNAGNTVIIIEHNPDIIAEADWIIDLGPEGGDEGGRIVAAGKPRDLVTDLSQDSPTITYLKEFLDERGEPDRTA